MIVVVEEVTNRRMTGIHFSPDMARLGWACRADGHLGMEHPRRLIGQHEKCPVESEPDGPARGHAGEDGMKQPRQLEHPQHCPRKLLEHGPFIELPVTLRHVLDSQHRQRLAAGSRERVHADVQGALAVVRRGMPVARPLHALPGLDR